MEILTDIRVMQQVADEHRAAGRTIALVPTMGFFHEGHLSLMRLGRARGDLLVVSLFVNPTQFGPGEDFKEYPRDLDRDLRLAAEVGVDLIFEPSVEAMYPPGFQTFVTVEEVTRGLCGAARPGHFRGVATVVAKLFHIVKPHVAIFGEKDYQQLVTIRRMVRDLNLDIEVVGHPIVREPDGLALSSRNLYLSPAERVSARSLSQALERAKALYRAGERQAAVLAAEARGVIEAQPHTRVDYVAVCDRETLEPLDEVKEGAVVALAVFVGRARLIDNCLLP